MQKLRWGAHKGIFTRLFIFCFLTCMNVGRTNHQFFDFFSTYKNILLHSILDGFHSIQYYQYCVWKRTLMRSVFPVFMPAINFVTSGALDNLEPPPGERLWLPVVCSTEKLHFSILLTVKQLLEMTTKPSHRKREYRPQLGKKAYCVLFKKKGKEMPWPSVFFDTAPRLALPLLLHEWNLAHVWKLVSLAT